MKKMGFGCMRLPMRDGTVDRAEFGRMVDAFLQAGFCYFDTAHGYLNGESEKAVRDCLTSRYPREAYLLTDKLSTPFFEQEADILPLFERQLERTGVSYFDYYLLHAMNASYYEKFTRCNAFAILQRLKAEGRIRHIGMSFHDTPALLERILSEHPEIEVVQIQFNYADYDSPTIESRAVYDVCRRFEKPILVMEPLKGGSLVHLPDAAQTVLDGLGGGSAASYALRYAASFEGVFMVLSGMSDYAQALDNIGSMREFQPFSAQEYAAMEQVRGILKQQKAIPCTACRYCVPGCPMHIHIPDIIDCCNRERQFQDGSGKGDYAFETKNGGKASDCIACGQCEGACPQHLPIIECMKQAADLFE